MNQIRHIYFRGSLRSCNYSCSYCSFGKKTDKTDKENEQQVLYRFNEVISHWENPLKIMLIPYGEGLIHDYYRESMIRLSLLPQVEGISCQTNLSFNPRLFIEQIGQLQANVKRIKLWASFHPEMVDIESFVDKVHFLFHSGIDICVGIVGNKKYKEIILVLREKIDKRIYLFINALQGKAESLDKDEIAFFTSIDPLFPFDYKNAKAEITRCRGRHNTVFIDTSGKIYPCPRNPVMIGNILDGKPFNVPVCHKKRCDCYIAYSNLEDTFITRMMGEGAFWRIPERRKVEAIFFDIDGTLTDSTGRVPEKYKDAFKLLSALVPLYLSTSLPLLSAKRRLGNLFNLFSGGVFADGGHIRNGQNDQYIFMTPIPDIEEKGCKVKKYADSEQVYKYVLKGPSADHIVTLKEEFGRKYNLYHKDTFLSIVDSSAGKKNGLEYICRKEQINLDNVVAIGNTLHDSSMLSCVGYPCAVTDAEDGLKEMAGYILNPDHLPAFFIKI